MPCLLQRLVNLDSPSKSGSPPFRCNVRRHRSRGRSDVCAVATAEHPSRSELGSSQRARDRDGRPARKRHIARDAQDAQAFGARRSKFHERVRNYTDVLPLQSVYFHWALCAQSRRSCERSPRSGVRSSLDIAASASEGLLPDRHLRQVPKRLEPGTGSPFFDSWAIFGNTHRAGYYGGTWNVDGSKQPVDDYSTTFIQERGIEFIREHSSPNQPWALFLSTAAPHAPFTPEPRFKETDVSRRRPVEGLTDRRSRTKPGFIKDRRSSA